MPRNVPASTSPLPATNSSSFRWLGKIPYFSGEKNVACTPNPNSTANSTGIDPIQNPTAASAISPSSQIFTIRMLRDFSNRSANCPAVADSSTYGRMNTPPANATNAGPEDAAALNSTSTTSAFLNRLSLMAPSPCVISSGARRREVSNDMTLNSRVNIVHAYKHGLNDVQEPFVTPA